MALCSAPPFNIQAKTCFLDIFVEMSALEMDNSISKCLGILVLQTFQTIIMQCITDLSLKQLLRGEVGL